MKFGAVRRLLFGEALATHRMRHQLLPKYLALPVFSSDALSSVAYATEEVLWALAAAGMAALTYGVSIAICISALIIIVSLSYAQTVMAYPSGGGSYIVARENLGTYPGLIAAAALLTDYVLTVAVSIAAGVAAITSAFPALRDSTELICLLCIAFVTLVNLRGAKESGKLFAIPTYSFIACLYIMIVVGAFRIFTGHVPSLAHSIPEDIHRESFTLFLVLRAFASGCSALTGVEAISNGVPAFQEPQSRNARTTLFWMAGVLMTMFLGISFLANTFHVVPDHDETVVSQLARAIVGRGWFYYVIQAATALILILAANTSYADFPRLSSILARDGFAPRQLANLGDRLVFSNGILLLGICSSVLIIAFQGKTHHLIPLYAVGVFLSFTLSQAGMVRHWFTCRGGHWKLSAVINAIGATTTAVVLIVIAYMKFVHGAWIVVILIPLIVWHFIAVHRHYKVVAEQLRMQDDLAPRVVKHHVIVLVPGIHRGIVRALAYARTISNDAEAVYVEIDSDPIRTNLVVEDWKRWVPDMPLRVLKSPWRSMLDPFLGYVDMLLNQKKVDLVTVVIPEFVPAKLWHRILHNASGLTLKFILLFKPNVVVTNIRYHLDR